MASVELDSDRTSPPAAPNGLPLLGELLVDRGLVSREQVDEALALQHQTGKLLGEILVTSGAVSKLALANVLAQQYGVELEEERGYGNGLLGEIARRANAAATPLEEEPRAEEPVEDDDGLAPPPYDLPEELFEASPAPLLDTPPEALLEAPPEPLPDLSRLDAALTAREHALAGLDDRIVEAHRRLDELERTLAELEEGAAANLEVDYSLARMFPEGAARENLALPIRFEDGAVVVAIAEPDDEALAEVERLVAREVRFVRAGREVVQRAIEAAYAATPAAR